MKTKNRMRFQYIYDFTLLEKTISEGFLKRGNEHWFLLVVAITFL